MSNTLKHFLTYFISLMAAVLFVTGLFLIETSAAVLTSGDYTYTVLYGEAEITGYTGTDDTIVIPSVIDGYPVTSIGKNAFKGNSIIRNVTISEGITSIGSFAFMNSKLESVVIPDTVTSLGSKCFYGTKLTSVNIPSGITSITGGAFGNCQRLTSVILPDTITEIRAEAFNYCFKLAEISLPDSLTYLGIEAFGLCESLESVTIPGSVSVIDEYCFNGCLALKEITIGNGVEVLGKAAFQDCTSLISIEIPESVNSMGWSVFEYCDNLKSIEVSPLSNSFSSLDGVLFDKDMTILYYYPMDKEGDTYSVPDGVKSVFRAAFDDQKHIKNIIFPEGFTDIDNSAFHRCPLESVTFPESIANINPDAFSCCTSLKTVCYGGSVVQWNRVDIQYGNVCILDADIHFAKTVPTLSEFVLTHNGEEQSLLGKKKSGIKSAAEALPIEIRISFTDNEKVTDVYAAEMCGDEKRTIEAVWNPEKNAFVIENACFDPDNPSYLPQNINVFYSIPSEGETDAPGMRSGTEIVLLKELRGYAFEAVTNNPLSGVTVKAYCLDEYDREVQWDASEYDQQNPVLTDNTGYYAWDVPRSEWRVKYELDGYKTAYSDWMTVPPAHTDVNIGLVSMKAPEVEKYEFSDTGVTITFDKYIDPTTINNIVIKDKNSKTLTYTVDYSKEEKAADGTVYARTFTFNCGEKPDLVEIPETVLSYSEAKAAANKIENPAANILYGDVNGDGKILSDDVTLIRKYIVGGWDVEIDLAAADVNCDGKILSDDVTLVRKYIVGGWDVELGKAG